MTTSSLVTAYVLPCTYALANIVVACGIVFANKAVFSVFNFHYVFALTWFHTLATWAGMGAMGGLGFFTPKAIPALKLMPLAACYVGYIVLCNISLNVNSVGFYQIMKIAITPTILVLEFGMFRKVPSVKVALAVTVVCAGIAGATVTDTVVIRNHFGLMIGLAATLVTGLYQIWAGSKQKELGANSSQLLMAYTPQAVLMLGLLVPMFERVGWVEESPDTLLGYQYTVASSVTIVVSAILGVGVSLTTFLLIGATSSLTYNIVGHSKTVIILAGGCFWFGDAMPWKRLLGVCTAMLGIAWYTLLTVQATNQQLLAVKTEKRESDSPLTTPTKASTV